MIQRVLIFASAAIVVISVARLVLPQGDPTKRQLMRAKAGYAHRLLDAVVQQDFQEMQEQAFRLKAVAETADWNIGAAPELVREREGFIHASERLRAAAEERNGDAATLAYLDVTLRCVQCHRLLHDSR